MGLISLRKRYSHLFCRDTFLTDQDVWWRHHWDDPYNYVCFVLHDHQAREGYGALLIAFNAGGEVRGCDVPSEQRWFRLIDTNLPPPADICEDEQSAQEIQGGTFFMGPYSCIVLKAQSANAADFTHSDQEFVRSQSQSLLPVSSCASLAPSQDEVMGSMMRRNASRSGFLLMMPGEGPNEESSLVMDRPTGPKGSRSLDHPAAS